MANIVIDEAHLIDQWGTEFRPYFQIFAAVFHALRKAANANIKCCLMSATFTEKTLKILSELFSSDGGSLIEVHGSFLRPEIQYSVHRVSIDDHPDEVMKAVWRLPKPMIVYAVIRIDAEKIFKRILSAGFSRVGLFTGRTSAADRENLLRDWAQDKIDIMVATSAFGVGMDKNNIRSVLHAAVPENLDRFYQEVGRAGRDGLASQSLLIYHTGQYDDAERINSNRLITVELGLKRWKKMWETGKACLYGKRVINIRTKHEGIQRTSDSNEEWNWRTLLLMQRSKFIEINIDPPTPPGWDSEIDEVENQKVRSAYYDSYYVNVTVSPVGGEHLDSNIWEQRIGYQRDYEKISQKQGYDRLKNWLESSKSTPLCNELVSFYTVRRREPEHACGGCPGCRTLGRKANYITTIGHVSHVIGFNRPREWHHVINTKQLHLPIYYTCIHTLDERKLIRQWIGWISDLVEQGVVTAIRS